MSGNLQYYTDKAATLVVAAASNFCRNVQDPKKWAQVAGVAALLYATDEIPSALAATLANLKPDYDYWREKTGLDWSDTQAEDCSNFYGALLGQFRKILSGNDLDEQVLGQLKTLAPDCSVREQCLSFHGYKWLGSLAAKLSCDGDSDPAI